MVLFYVQLCWDSEPFKLLLLPSKNIRFNEDTLVCYAITPYSMSKVVTKSVYKFSARFGRK